MVPWTGAIEYAVLYMSLSRVGMLTKKTSEKKKSWHGKVRNLERMDGGRVEEERKRIDEEEEIVSIN